MFADILGQIEVEMEDQPMGGKCPRPSLKLGSSSPDAYCDVDHPLVFQDSLLVMSSGTPAMSFGVPQYDAPLAWEEAWGL